MQGDTFYTNFLSLWPWTGKIRKSSDSLSSPLSSKAPFLISHPFLRHFQWKCQDWWQPRVTLLFSARYGQECAPLYLGVPSPSLAGGIEILWTAWKLEYMPCDSSVGVVKCTLPHLIPKVPCKVLQRKWFSDRMKRIWWKTPRPWKMEGSWVPKHVEGHPLHNHLTMGWARHKPV